MSRTVLALSLALAACAFVAEDEVATAQRPAAILDAYLIAHGMAAGYATRPDADPRVVTELARLDIRAAEALRRLADQRGGDLAATASAVAALTDYAARQTETVAR